MNGARVLVSLTVLACVPISFGAVQSASATRHEGASPAARPVPSFTPAQNYATAPDPASLAAGDLNGDGKTDLAVANPSTDTSRDTVSVLLNRGDGTFQPRRNYATGELRSVAISDLNGDGKGDLATANAVADTIAVLLNRGDGTFQSRRDYASGRTLRGSRSAT